MIVLLRSLAGAADGAVGVACVGSQMGANGRGVLVHLCSGIRIEVNDIGFLEIICSSDLDHTVSLIGYSQSSKVNWTLNEPIKRLYPYKLSSRSIYDVPERLLASVRCDSTS